MEDSIKWINNKALIKVITEGRAVLSSVDSTPLLDSTKQFFTITIHLNTSVKDFPRTILHDTIMTPITQLSTFQNNDGP